MTASAALVAADRLRGTVRGTLRSAVQEAGGALQDAGGALQDTAAALQDADTHGMGFDTVRVESPLPGGVADVVRFFFHVPRWIQIGGAILGALVAIALLVWMWRRRAEVVTWVRTRSRGGRLALAGVALLLVAAAVGAGTVSWDYIQHDNDFCTGCHVMGPSYRAFTTSEHADLNCHDCHQQSIFASMRQLVMWVAERPEDIGSHAEIPNAICQQCHATGESETWTHVEATAGHRVHFESDDPELADLECLTCHAPAVHEFSPVDATCAQAGCHEEMDIRLGGMANQTSLHCATCHEFTAEVAALATTDSAAGRLVPGFDRCGSCHEMREMLGDFDPELEPHDARCGVCHDPHEQTVAAEAADTCADCHDDWRNEPFHVGDAHADAGSQCTLCHEPHRARVDASDCAACHGRIAADPEAPAGVRQRLRSAQPFDTAAALRESRGPGAVPEGAAADGLEPSIATLVAAGDPARGVALALAPPAERAASPADTFEHRVHDELNCITCHTTTEGHGGLTFERPRGCQICHHRAPARSVCVDCHPGPEALPDVAADVPIRPVPDAEPVHRTAEFAHAAHEDLDCVDCHQAPVTLEPPAEVATCASCHEDHHAGGIACAACHGSERRRAGAGDRTGADPHAPPAAAHEACAACHAPGTIDGLHPDRSFCVTCHEAMAEHEPEGTCTTCHLLESPGEYERRLARDDPAAS